MVSYKEASERMNMTGNGLEGLEHSNFQEWVVNNICRYYFILDLVLKDRPKVTPWYTNEEEDTSGPKRPTKYGASKNKSIFLCSSDSDDDPMESRKEFSLCNTDNDSDLKVVKNPYKRTSSRCNNKEAEYEPACIKSNVTTAIAHNDNNFVLSNNYDDSNSIDLSSPCCQSNLIKKSIAHGCKYCKEDDSYVLTKQKLRFEFSYYK